MANRGRTSGLGPHIPPELAESSLRPGVHTLSEKPPAPQALRQVGLICADQAQSRLEKDSRMTVLFGRQVPQPTVHYEAHSHEALKEMTDLADPGGVQYTAEEWRELAAKLTHAGDLLSQAVLGSEEEWTGQAGDAMRDTLRKVAEWSSNTAHDFKVASSAITAQCEAADRARFTMPDPVPYDPGRMLSEAMPNPIKLAALAVEIPQRYEEHRAAHAVAVQVVAERDAAMAEAAASVPPFTPPPTRIIIEPPPGTGEEEEPDPNDEDDSKITERRGSHDPARRHVSDEARESREFLPVRERLDPFEPPVTRESLEPGADDGTERGLDGRDITSPGGYVAPDGGTGSSSSGRLTPAPSGSGAGPGAGIVPGVAGSGGGFRSGESLSAGRPGAGAGGSGTGRLGRGAAAAGSSGRAGTGSMGSGGSRAQGEEDTEHERPAYLQEADPDSLFGTDETTAPPVIGA